MLCDRDTGDPPKVLQCSQKGPGPGTAAGTVPMAIYYQILHSTEESLTGAPISTSQLSPLAELKIHKQTPAVPPLPLPSVLMPQPAPGMAQMNEFQVSHRLMCHQPRLLDTLRRTTPTRSGGVGDAQRLQTEISWSWP